MPLPLSDLISYIGDLKVTAQNHLKPHPLRWRRSASSWSILVVGYRKTSKLVFEIQVYNPLFANTNSNNAPPPNQEFFFFFYSFGDKTWPPVAWHCISLRIYTFHCKNTNKLITRYCLHWEICPKLPFGNRKNFKFSDAHLFQRFW